MRAVSTTPGWPRLEQLSSCNLCQPVVVSRAYDALLVLQVVAAADPAQLEMWQDQEHTVAEGNQRQRGRSFTAAQFKAKCSSWWHPRQPRLPIKAAATVVDVQVRATSTQGNALRWNAGCDPAAGGALPG